MLLILILYIWGKLQTVAGSLNLENSVYIESISELAEFFKTSYIRKESGNFDVKQKKFIGIGYNPTWSIYRFHHACVRGGSDGVYVSMKDVPNVMHGRMKDDNGQLFSQGQWNELIGARFHSPLTAYTVEERHFDQNMKPVLYMNSTLFCNCNRQHSMATNPSHFAMKVGFMYELGQALEKNFGKQRLLKNHLQTPFRQLVLHQCPNPENSNWHWGRAVWRVVEGQLNASHAVDSNTRLMRRGNEAPESEFMCFEDLYLSNRAGHWLQGKDNIVRFRKDAARIIGEPKEAARVTENIRDAPASGFFQSYCNKNFRAGLLGEKVSSAKIKVFHHPSTSFLSDPSNLRDVLELLQSYTTVPVEVFTLSEKDPIDDQIRHFNSFDIMVTSHGNHLTNGIFTMRPHTKAVVEIVASVHDPIFFRNFNFDLGFAEYIISSGHTAPNPATNAKKDAYCPFHSLADFTAKDCYRDVMVNSGKLPQDWMICAPTLNVLSCQVLVNVTILKDSMDSLMYKSLCKPGGEPLSIFEDAHVAYSDLANSIAPTEQVISSNSSSNSSGKTDSSISSPSQASTISPSVPNAEYGWDVIIPARFNLTNSSFTQDPARDILHIGQTVIDAKNKTVFRHR